MDPEKIEKDFFIKSGNIVKVSKDNIKKKYEKDEEKDEEKKKKNKEKKKKFEEDEDYKKDPFVYLKPTKEKEGEYKG